MQTHLSFIENNIGYLIAKNRAKKKSQQAENWSLLIYIQKNLNQVCDKKLIR